MTIPATASEISYAGDGASTAFPIPFVFDTASDLKVTTTIAGVITTITTGFSVSGGSGSTGTLTFSVAPEVGTTIGIFDDPQITQPTDYVDNDAFPAESHERALDRVTRLVKRLSQKLSRALRFSDGDSATDGTLSDVATRKGKYLFFNPTTGALEYASSIGSTALTQALFDAYVRTSVDIDTQGISAGGRLTLTSGTAVTTSDVTGATTIYYTPHQHDRIKLYDGTIWKWYTFTELSQALSDTTKSPSAAAANKNYDKFVWDQTPTAAPTLLLSRGPDWTVGGGSDTVRGTGAGSTELEEFNGRWVNKYAITNGPPARRGLFVGTFRTDGSTQVNDSSLKRHVWNRYNRVTRLIRVNDATLNWTYNTNAYRLANNNSANQADIVVGLSIDPVVVLVLGNAAHSSALVPCAVGVGIDSSTVNSAQQQAGFATTSRETPVHAYYNGYPGLGRHTIAWLENGLGQGVTTTWTGTNNNGGLQSGLSGEVMA